MNAIFNVVLPVFALVLCGYLAGRSGVLTASATEALNKFVFWFALPALMFTGMAALDVAALRSGTVYIALFVASSIGTFSIAMLVAAYLFPQRNGATVLHALAGCFANTGYMGIPLCQIAFGPQGVAPALMATAVNTIVCIGGAVTLIELGEHKGGNVFTVLRGTVIAVLRNPIVVSPALGVAWALGGLPLPEPVVAFGNLLGVTAGPCALFALGLFLVGKPIERHASAELGWVVALKLIVHPLIAFVLLQIVPIEQLWATVCMVMAALPTGGLVFVMALRYQMHVQRVSEAILVSTVLALGTLSALFWYYGVA